MKSKQALPGDDWQTIYDSERDMLLNLLVLLRAALVERGLQHHAIYARVDRALASSEIAELRAALESWKSLPLRVRADLLR